MSDPLTSKKVLVIDDERVILDMITERLSMDEGYDVLTCEDPQAALSILSLTPVNAIITDISMPKLNGLQLLEEVANFDPKIPVILMTGYSDQERMRAAIKLGAFDFLRKPFQMAELSIAVKQALEKNALLIQNYKYQKDLEALVLQRTLALAEANERLEKNYVNTIHAMVNTIEANDPVWRGHSERVTALSLMLGRELGLSSDELKVLRIGTLLHDLGKIGIYKPLLDKVSPLSDDEYEMIKEHPTIGARIIGPIGLPTQVSEIILQHHEWCDGNGYPQGLSVDMISPLARITAIADAFDAMTGQRPYREIIDPCQACDEIRKNLGTQFDPEAGMVFCSNLDQIQKVLQDGNHLRESIYRDL